MKTSYSNTDNPELYAAALEGGLSTEEAEDLTRIDPPTNQTGDYEPSNIPAIAKYLERQPENIPIPAKNTEEYIELLLERPQEVVDEWSTGGYPFENNGTTIREKRDEYTIRTIYALQDSIDQSLIDKALQQITTQTDYRKETAETLSEGNLGLLLGQYIEPIEELIDDQEILNAAYDNISETSETSQIAAANKPAEQLPEHITDNIYLGGTEISSDRVRTRLRKMRGAGRCEDLEQGHREVLLSEQPTKNNSIITLNDEPVGSIKHTGQTSMLGLQDLTYQGRQVLQKGMTYRASHPVLKEMNSKRIEKQEPTHLEWENIFEPDEIDERQKEEYQDWEIIESEVLELRPLRFAGQEGDLTIEEFREEIETKRQQIQDEIK